MKNKVCRRRNRQARIHPLSATFMLVVIALLLGGCGTRLPVSQAFTYRDGTTWKMVSKRFALGEYCFRSGTIQNGGKRAAFHLQPLSQGQVDHFAWRIYYDRKLEAAVTGFFHGDANGFWEKHLGRLQTFSARVFGSRDNCLDLVLCFVPDDVTFDSRVTRKDPDHIPLSFYCPVTTRIRGEKTAQYVNHRHGEFFEDQMVGVLLDLAHEYAHARIAVAGINFPNDFSEEVAVETFAYAFMATFANEITCRASDGTPVGLSVNFPDPIPVNRDDRYMFSAQMGVMNIVHCLGKNVLSTDADSQALLNLSRAIIQHPHDFTKSFFPVELIESEAPAAARTEVPDQQVPITK